MLLENMRREAANKGQNDTPKLNGLEELRRIKHANKSFLKKNYSLEHALVLTIENEISNFC